MSKRTRRNLVLLVCLLVAVIELLIHEPLWALYAAFSGHIIYTLTQGTFKSLIEE